MEGSATQLADTRPQLDCPLRVAIPVNAPERKLKLSRDQYIYRNAFSPSAQAHSRNSREEMDTSNPNKVHMKKVDLNERVDVNMDHDAMSKTQISDFNTLAFQSSN